MTWQDEGICGRYDPELWFSSIESEETEEAKSICQECPVRNECLSYAIRTREDYGVWGGLDENERRVVVRYAKIVDYVSRVRSNGRPPDHGGSRREEESPRLEDRGEDKEAFG